MQQTTSSTNNRDHSNISTPTASCNHPVGSSTSSSIVTSGSITSRRFSSNNHGVLSEHEINKLNKWKDNLEDDHYICPISHVLMSDPVILSESGITFDRTSITQWLQTHNTCPITKKRLETKNLIPNYSTKNLIHLAMKKNISKVIHFVEKRIVEKRGLNECLEVVHEILQVIDKHEISCWRDMMMLKYKIKISMDSHSTTPQAWCDYLTREFLAHANLNGSSTTTTYTEDTALTSALNLMLDQLSSFDSDNEQIYSTVKTTLEQEKKRKQEAELRIKLEKEKKAKILEERRRREQEELRRAAAIQQQQEDWTVGAAVVGVLGATALAAVGIYALFKPSRDDKR
ncbi:hypothetical protein C9374_007033 [Naegleria lovaniensis]|uniref:U-box domain-containing protein n=1 Tax=Naegleria lovaniensis TaxID=51637 RepID=A0AA88KRS5_NAELO|nr:uncharacterized protein C9374_007033 [Naegleria lovaniensis]KAG2393502.1 hypothetical protein C9374_007033 [Naegleria lovaniensis]